jgi:pimeloyl-ACP methyl ester carboxylesterase
VEHEGIGICAEFGDNERYPLRHQSRNEGDVARQPVELGYYDRAALGAPRGLVNGKNSLAISFRGTDQFADFDDYLDFGQHFAKFKQLIDALKPYIAETGIEQVLVSGHSLGAGMAQTFLSKFPNTAQTKFLAVTDGSPGSDAGKSDTRIMNFIQTDDVDTHVPLMTSPEGKAVLGALAKAIGKLHKVVGPAVEIALRTILANLKEKDRAGSDIEIDSAVTSGILPGLGPTISRL